MSISNNKLVFVTGASRSGTTLLSFILRNHHSVFGLKELHYFGTHWDPRVEGKEATEAELIDAAADIFMRQAQGILTRGDKEPFLDAARKLVRELSTEDRNLAGTFVAATTQLAKAENKTIPCEQTPRNIFYADSLLDQFPNAHIVHMLRDPRAVMSSQKGRWKRRSLATDTQKFSRYESLRVWINYHPYTIARLWKRATAQAMRMSTHSRFHVLRFEDLLSDPEHSVRNLCEQLGLEFEPAMLDVGRINSSHASSVGGAEKGFQTGAIDQWRDKLSPSEIAITERICASQMGDYQPSEARTGALGELPHKLSYLLHLAGVVLINPRRALVQSRALMQGQKKPGRKQLRSDTDKSGQLIRLMDMSFLDCTLSEAADIVIKAAQLKNPLNVFFVNAHCVNVAQRDTEYKKMLHDAPFVFADGAGMALAAKILGSQLCNNVNGTDLFPIICETAAKEGIRIGLHGAAPGIAENCANKMREQIPGLEIVHVSDGYLNAEAEEQAVEEMNRKDVQILFVAKGVPLQEHWIQEHRDRVNAPVMLAVGALFDFYSGTVERAPVWVRQMRLEWLYRLAQEPRRLFRRYVIGNPEFVLRTIWMRMTDYAG